MGFSAAGVPFLGLGLAFLKELFLCPLGGRGQNEELSLVRGWGVAGGCSLSYDPPPPPRLFFNLFFPQGSMTVRRGAERERAVWDWVRFSEQLLQYPIYKSSPGEKEWFLAEFYVRLKEKHNLTASSLGYGLFCQK